MSYVEHINEMIFFLRQEVLKMTFLESIGLKAFLEKGKSYNLRINLEAIHPEATHPEAIHPEATHAEAIHFINMIF